MSEKTFVLISSEFFPVVGGAGKNTLSLAKGLSAISKPVEVITWNKGSATASFDSVQTFKITRLQGSMPTTHTAIIVGYVKFWIHLIFRKAQKDSIFIIMDWHSVVYTNYLFALLGRAYYAYVLGSEITAAFSRKSILSILSSGFYDRSKMLFPISSYTKKVLLEYAPHCAEKTEIIPPPIEFPDVEAVLPNSKLIRNRYAISDDSFVILQVSRVVERKGHIYGLKAIAALPETFKKRIVYLIGGDGPLVDTLKKSCIELNVENNVLFTGNIRDEEMAYFYDACDIFMMPSITSGVGAVEGFGITFLEAAARKKTSIGTRHGGIIDVVLDNKTGILVEEKNETDLCNAIIRLMNDKTMTRQLAENAYEYYKEFSIQKVANKLCAVINR